MWGRRLATDSRHRLGELRYAQKDQQYEQYDECPSAKSDTYRADSFLIAIQAAIAVALLAGIIIAALAISFHSGIIYSQWLTGM